MFGGKPYFVLLVLCWMYALLKGGRPERIGATILAVGSVLSVAFVPVWAGRAARVETGVLLIDLLGLVACVALAMRADRFWPIWVAALLGVGALGHLARWYDGSDISMRVYAMSLALWSYPILIIIAIGTFNHSRRVAREASSRSPSAIAPRAKAEALR